MKNIIIPFLLFSVSTFAKSETAKLRYSMEFILEKVLEKKHQKYNPEIPMPSLHMASVTPLQVFHDAISEQWGGFKPDVITNAYSMKHNMIFLSDEAEYYERTGRCIDDSLAHELTHYVQDRYLHWDFSDESLEWDAIEIQTQFREEYCKNS